MSDILRLFFQKQKPRLDQFLTHCIVRRALRSVPEMKRFRRPVIGIVAGGNASIGEIQDALMLLRLPNIEALETCYLDASTVFLDCEPANRRKPRALERTEEELVDALKGKRAIFAVAEEEEDLPPLFRVGGRWLPRVKKPPRCQRE